MISLYRFAGLLAALLLSTGAYADDIRIENAWARATAPGRTSANVYFYITSKQAATLVGASSPASKSVEMRTMTHKGGMMKTHNIDSVSLAANQPINMSSQHGPHLTLVDLNSPLKANETVPLTLSIEMPDKHIIKVDVHAEIRPLKK